MTLNREVKEPPELFVEFIGHWRNLRKNKNYMTQKKSKLTGFFIALPSKLAGYLQL